MEVGTVSGRLADSMQQLTHHWQDRRRAVAQQDSPDEAPPGFTIAIARQAGTQGTSIARELGAQLGWPVYDHELLEQIAQELGVRTALLESVDERRVGWLEEAFEQFLEVPQVSENSYARHLVRCVLALGAHGECIIVGRGASFILPPESTLRVRLVAPKRDRLATLSRNLDLAGKQATRKLMAIDRASNDFVKGHFLTDPTDPANYDLLLNVSRFGRSEACVVMIAALHRLQARRSVAVAAQTSS